MNTQKFIEKIIVLGFALFCFYTFGGGIFHVIGSGYVLIIIGLLITTYYLTSKKALFAKLNYKALFIYIILWIFMLISLTQTQNLSYGKYKVFWVLAFILVSFLFSPILIRHLYFFMICNLFFLLLYLVALHVEYGNIDHVMSEYGGVRLSMEDENDFGPISIGRYLVLNILNLVFLNYYTFIYRKRFKYLLLTFSIILLGYVSIYIFFTGTRSPIIAFILAFFLYFVLRPKSFRLRNFVSILGVFLILGMSIYFVGKYINASGHDAVDEFVVDRYDNPDIAFEGRMVVFERAIKLISLDYSLIIGEGAGNYGFLLTGISNIKSFPHNIFLEILVENGFIALILFLYIIAQICYRNLFMEFSSKYMYLIVIFYFMLINAQSSNDLVGNGLVFAFSAILLNIPKSNV